MLGRKVLPAFSRMTIRIIIRRRGGKNQPEHESPGLISILGEVA